MLSKKALSKLGETRNSSEFQARTLDHIKSLQKVCLAFIGLS